jgi:hypothetical protein
VIILRTHDERVAIAEALNGTAEVFADRLAKQRRQAWAVQIGVHGKWKSLRVEKWKSKLKVKSSAAAPPAASPASGSTRADYLDYSSRDDALSGGVKMIPITTPKGMKNYASASSTSSA